MATYINAATSTNRVKLWIQLYSLATSTTAGDGDGTAAIVQADFMTIGGGGAITEEGGAFYVPSLQDITLNNSNGSFRWKQLDQDGESVITTNATNSLSGNFVLDPTTFFGSTGAAGTTAEELGIFNLANKRHQVAFMLSIEGDAVGKRALVGNGFISGLAPTVSADSPVWVSPITIEVNGDLTQITLDD